MAAAQGLLDGGERNFLGPTYDYSEELPPPSSIGVRVGDSFDQVYTNIKGVNYYVDAIGFGQATFLNDHAMQPLGLRYFLDTGFTCSNGAARYEYQDSTPQGDALGTFVKNELAAEGLPQMRGLAPGMLEDAERALNPIPLFRAVLTDSGYCNCKQVDLPVGDMNGGLISKSGTPWISVADVYYKDPNGTVHPTPGAGRIPYQKKWVRDTDITADQYNSTPKIYNSDGTARSATDLHVDSVRSAGGVEPFTSKHPAFGGNNRNKIHEDKWNRTGIVVAGATAIGVALVALFVLRKK